MSDVIRWDLIDRIPDDMQIYGSDHSEGQWTWPQWREYLGHPYAEGHGFCKTCGAGGPCDLAAFYDAVMVSTIRELDTMGALRAPMPRTESRVRIMQVLLKAIHPLSARELAIQARVSHSCMYKNLIRMEADGWVRAPEGQRPRGHGVTRYYMLTEHSRMAAWKFVRG